MLRPPRPSAPSLSDAPFLTVRPRRWGAGPTLLLHPSFLLRPGQHPPQIVLHGPRLRCELLTPIPGRCSQNRRHPPVLISRAHTVLAGLVIRDTSAPRRVRCHELADAFTSPDPRFSMSPRRPRRCRSFEICP